jgi:hypothetical protein
MLQVVRGIGLRQPLFYRVYCCLKRLTTCLMEEIAGPLASVPCTILSGQAICLDIVKGSLIFVIKICLTIYLEPYCDLEIIDLAGS